MSDCQAWAVVLAVLSTGMDGVGRGVGAVLAVLFLLADARERSAAAAPPARGGVE